MQAVAVPPAGSAASVALQFEPRGGASLRDATLHRQHADGHATFRAPFGSQLSAWFEVRGEDVLAWIENHGTTTVTGRLSLTWGATERVAYDAVVVGPRMRAALWPQRLSGGEWPLVARSVAPPLVPPVRKGVSKTYLSWLPQVYTPLMRGMYEEAIGAAGTHGGLLNPWDMAYLASGDQRALRSVVLHGLAAGRYSIHHRDAVTHDVLSFAANPYLSSNASSRGQYIPEVPVANKWVISHHPSVGYLAHLLTGWEFFADEVRFAAAHNHFSQVDSERRFSAGILRTDSGSNTTRGAAWALRTLLHAALISGADSQYARALEANIRYYLETYAAPGVSPFGIARPYSDYSGAGDRELHHAMWMEDFLTAVLCWVALARPGDDKAKALAHWKSRSTVARLGDPAEPDTYDYRDAASYEMTVAPEDLANIRFAAPSSGPWYATAAAWWRAVTKGRHSRTDDRLLRGTSASAPTMASAYWGIVYAAAAMAAQVRAPGADAALSRLTGAANWPAIANDFQTWPMWAVSTERTAMPAPKITVYIEGTEEEVPFELVRSAPPGDQSAEIAALTAQRDALQAQVTTLTSQVSAITAERDALQAKITAAKVEADDAVREAQQARDALN